jgi:hypothetical protein
MATLFDVTIPSNILTLDAKRSGQITFTVANATGRSLGAIAQVVSSDPSIQSWFQIEQGASRRLAPHETVQYTVTVVVPATAAPQSYTFHLVIADEANPDDNFTSSPDVRVTAPAPVVPTKKPFPWWIIAVIAAVVVVVIIIIAVVASNQASANANATATASANAATQTALAANAATQTAAAFAQQTAVAATQTAASIFATQTQQARPTPTFTPRPPATVTVSNNGGFLAQFTVSYGFSGGGQTQTTGQFPVGSSQSITIPGDAFNIVVQIQVNTGFNLRDACGAFNFSPAQNKHYTVSGTTFGSSCSEP